LGLKVSTRFFLLCFLTVLRSRMETGSLVSVSSSVDLPVPGLDSTTNPQDIGVLFDVSNSLGGVTYLQLFVGFLRIVLSPSPWSKLHATAQ
jgi:hypothetical protein